MDLKESLVKGGVVIVHQIHEGKHQYEVENVMKYKKVNGAKAFVRKGDKLMQINGKDLQDVTPEELAEALADGNPMLTVHKASKMTWNKEQFIADEDTLRPVSKETTMLSFSMELKREEDLEENEVGKEGGGSENGGKEEDVCKPESEEKEEDGDLLVVSMTKTSISVVRGRGCEDGSPCQGCHGTGCTFNEVVVVAESSKVTLVPRGSESFKQLKSDNGAIQNVDTHLYLKGLCSQEIVCASENPEKITIYSYKSNDMGPFRGMPVVLNFAESDCFLSCCMQGEKVVLEVKTCEKQRLKQISKSDASTLAFVFYMKADAMKRRKFESARYLGWFIQNINIDCVEMGSVDCGLEDSFLFIIRK